VVQQRHSRRRRAEVSRYSDAAAYPAIPPSLKTNSYPSVPPPLPGETGVRPRAHAAGSARGYQRPPRRRPGSVTGRLRRQPIRLGRTDHDRQRRSLPPRSWATMILSSGATAMPLMDHRRRPSS
jgi:hypothetical protein